MRSATVASPFDIVGECLQDVLNSVHKVFLLYMAAQYTVGTVFTSTGKFVFCVNTGVILPE